ncbi:MAG: L,D-transpeptidase family protein [Hyphomonadaceae bacterium]
MPATRFTASSRGLLQWSSHKVRCALGRTGVTPAESKREGDGASPAGVWPMRQLYWRADRLARPATGLPAIEIIPEAGWCDDPLDPFYNRPVILPYPTSHEKLWREDRVYDLIVELGYNDAPVVPGKGSAIFLHLAREDYSPTEGCIACALPDLLALLRDAKPGDELEITA